MASDVYLFFSRERGKQQGSQGLRRQQRSLGALDKISGDRFRRKIHSGYPPLVFELPAVSGPTVPGSDFLRVLGQLSEGRQHLLAASSCDRLSMGAQEAP
jgi:hypothetical protein